MSDESFTTEEQGRLAPFFTNLDRSVFGLKLPQEVAGALFSRYSRSARGLRRVFLDEFLGEMGVIQEPSVSVDADALKKARAFYDRVLVGYGDDSIAQLGGAHLACEGISNVAANVIEDARIGLAPLEKSTRYVRFDKKDSAGEYPFYKEPRLMASKHALRYLEAMNLLFDTYARQMDPVTDFIKKRLPVTEIPFKHPQTGEPLTYRDIERDEALKKWAESAYRSTIRAHACDVLRAYLPTCTKTNVGLFGVGQAFEYLLTKLYSHPLTEMRQLAEQMHGELNTMIPSFVKRARPNAYLSETCEGTRRLAQKYLAELKTEQAEAVTLLDCEADAEDRVLSAILYPHARHSLAQLRAEIKSWSPERRVRMLDEYLARRKHRRDKPGRALEQVYYTFDLLGNIGMYRDLHRHRILSQERQDFTVVHGYDTPKEIVEIGFKKSFDDCMTRAADFYDQIYADYPHEAQYGVPFAYRVRWSMKMNLRELIHIAELRTMPQGHPDYRRMVQEMCRQVEAVHPTLMRYARFIDWKDYDLGRLQAEMRTEYKKSTLSQDPSSRSSPRLEKDQPLQDKNRYALKEWAIVLKALSEGRQTLLLRKGGLIEKQKRFTVEHPEFFIYPTHLHQQRKGVIPEMAAELERLLQSPSPEDQVILSHYAVVHTAVPITDMEILKKLGKHHVFNSEEVMKRFTYGKAPGLNLLLVRVYRLPRPFCLPILPYYAGCRSWVDLGQELPTAGGWPVLNDDDFDRQAHLITKIAKPTNPS